MDIDWSAVGTALTATAAVSLAVTGVAAFLGKSLFQWMSARDLEAHKAKLAQEGALAIEAVRAEAAAALARQTAEQGRALERLKADLSREGQSEAQIRAEIRRWSNPILAAVDGLIGRLENVVADGGYVALQPQATPPADWSVTYDYFLPSTVYLFAQYFCWTELLRQELSFQLFETQADKDAFFTAQLDAGRCLSSWPIAQLDPQAPSACDAQVFALQQRQMGEALIVQGERGQACMSYAAFTLRWRNDSDFLNHFKPLKDFLQELSPNLPARWRRLEEMTRKLYAVRSACRRVLQLPEGG